MHNGSIQLTVCSINYPWCGITHIDTPPCKIMQSLENKTHLEWLPMTNNVHYHLGLSDGEHAGINFGAVGKHRLIQSEITMYSIQGFDGIIKQLMIKCICLMEQSECCLLNSWWFDDILSLVWMEQSTCKQVDLMEQSTCWWLISPFFSR